MNRFRRLRARATMVATMKKIEVLKEHLDEQIKWFDDESTKHKRMHRWMRYTAFFLTACSTGLASAALAYPGTKPQLMLAIIAISAIAGIAAAVEGLRKPAELWIHERTTHYALKDLKLLLDYKCSDTVDDAVVDDCFERLQGLLGASSEKWNRQVQPHQDAKPPEEPRLQSMTGK
jgi:hypothetical protein